MTQVNKKKFNRIMFPVGVFLLLFLVESIVGAGSVCTYYYLSGKKNIADIEKYTMGYSKTLAEAFSRVAEFSHKTKQYSSLKTLFHQKIEADTIDEAFFILNDGKIIAHSSTAVEKELKGNIANDEITYNLDLILQPVRQRSRKLFFSDYNIIDGKIPFSRDEKKLIKDYVYKGILSTGWLFTKGVFIKNRPVGTVNFIVSKERIHSSILYQMREVKKYSAVAVLMAFIISLAVSAVVMIRYRTIQRGAFTGISPESGAEIHQEEEVLALSDDSRVGPDFDEEIDEPVDDPVIAEEGTEEIYRPGSDYETGFEEDEYITIELLEDIDEEPGFSSENKIDEPSAYKKFAAPVISAEAIRGGAVKDAIPVERKR